MVGSCGMQHTHTRTYTIHILVHAFNTVLGTHFYRYCRFYQGRRSSDDSRQVSRWSKCAGAKGRWKQNLVAKCLAKGKTFDDESVSPVVRQTLQHWGYRLDEKDYIAGVGRVRTHGASYIPKEQLKHVMNK